MNQLTTLVNQQNWKDARLLANKLKENGESSDTFWILNSTIYQAEGNESGRFLSIILGLSQNPYNYELYYMLGEYYSNNNLDQGIMCMEQALLYCDKDDDYNYIASRIGDLKAVGGTSHKLSFIIYADSESEMLSLCLNSIQQTLPDNSYEIIVVIDENHTDTISFLNSMHEIKTIICPTNTNYGNACNLGIASSSQDYDIVLLHSDTITTPNSILWLKMGGYQDPSIGAAGCITNSCDNNQNIELNFDSLDKYLNYSHSINLPSINPYENKVLLADFGVLIKRTALLSIGGVIENYNENILELADLGTALTSQGYKNILCHNAFIFHFCLCKKDKAISAFNSSIETAQNKFIQKWGFNIKYYSNSRDELINLMNDDKKTRINVLEVGCGCGSTLSRIKYLYPNSNVYGIELMENIAILGTNMGDIISGNIEDIELPYDFDSLDYVIFGDVLEHLRDPKAVIAKLKAYLKPTGKIIASIPNLMHLSVIIPLLQGNFTYTEEGLLDKTHIHFFTKKEIIKLFEENGFSIEQLRCQATLGSQQYIDDNKDFAEKIYNLPNVAQSIEFETFQYLVVATK